MGIQPDNFAYSLKYQGVDYPLIYAPSGWETDTKVNFSRDKDYFGVMRKYSFPLKFVHDGADILRTAFTENGIEAEVEITISQLEKKTWTYAVFFNGDVDFSAYEYDGDTVTVTIMESGLATNLKAKEGTVFEYALVGNDVVNVILPPIEFTDELKFVILPTNTFDLNAARKYTVGMDLVKQDESGYIEGRNVEQRNAADSDDFSGDVFAVGRRESGVTPNIAITVKGSAVNNSPFNVATDVFLELRRSTDKAIVSTLVSFTDDFSPNEIRPFNLTIDFDYLLDNGQGLYLYVRTDTNSSAIVLSVTEGELTMVHKSKTDPSNCKGISAFNLYKRIINRISPGSIPISYLLQNKWKNLIITSGDGIREVEKAKIKISWRDFYQSLYSIDDVGFGIENRNPVLESAIDFVRNVQIIDLGEVSECTISIAKDYLFNTIKVGYKDGNTDEKNGKEEYNSGQVWEMPITRVIRDENLISPIRADQFGIEKIRVAYNVKTKGNTSDTSSDNDSFMVDCFVDGDNYRPILGSSFDSVSGLTSNDTAYNLNLSPKRNLLRHSAKLASLLDKLSSRYINFGSGDKNTDLVTVKDGYRVAEKDNILVSSLGSGYFLPYIANIKGLLPRNALQRIDLIPYGFLSFIHRGESYKGLILDMDIDLAYNANHEFKLLLIP